MSFNQKTWTDRIAEYITRRTLTKEDGSTEVVTVARNEGEISQEGDAFSASNMNDLEDRIASEFTQLNEELSSISTFTSESACRWLRFSPDNHKALVIKGGTAITTKGGVNFKYDEDITIDLTSYLGNKGTDYFVHIAEDGTISASTTKSTSIKCIGRFHTLCADVGTPTMIAPASPSSGLKVGGTYLVKSYRQEEDPDFYAFYNKTITAVTVQSAYDVITMAHPLSGYVAGDILPESVFCTTFYPSALYDDAMVYDKDTDRIIDVYIQSGTGFNTRSKYGATHTVSRTPHNHREDMRMVGKRLLKDSEYTSAALGSNERTAITGSKDQTTVGGHVDTANRRMISAIGCEEMCGYIWTWLDEVAPAGGSAWGVTDTHGSFGQEYGTPYVLGAGGGWASSSSCGSRSRSSYYSRSAVSAGSGGRGSSRVVRG